MDFRFYGISVFGIIAVVLILLAIIIKKWSYRKFDVEKENRPGETKKNLIRFFWYRYHLASSEKDRETIRHQQLTFFKLDLICCTFIFIGVVFFIITLFHFPIK